MRRISRVSSAHRISRDNSSLFQSFNYPFGTHAARAFYQYQIAAAQLRQQQLGSRCGRINKRRIVQACRLRAFNQRDRQADQDK